MRNLPDEIVIYGIPYEVVYHDSMTELDRMGTKKLYGRLVPDDSQMHIYRGRRHTKSIWKTIWHEIFHEILDSNRINLTDESNDDEQIINMLSVATNDILFRNKLNFSEEKNGKI